MDVRRFFPLIAWLAFAGPCLAAALPNTIAVKQATRLEILRDGRASGNLDLAVGETLSVIDVKDPYVLVRYRNVNGRVRAADTTLPPGFGSPAPSPAASTPVPTASAPPPGAATGAAATSTYVPTTPMERELAGKLVALEENVLRPLPAGRLAGVKFYALYFSAGWCPPCREFTPEFMDAYTKIRALYPEFEVVLVNRDRSPAAMFNYMQEDKMKWPALRWDHVRGADMINRYAGAGIPCLVLIDDQGKVLSDSYRWGRYVGPDAVLDDTWKILRDYRRQNARKKS